MIEGFFKLKICGSNDDSYHRVIAQGGDVSLLGSLGDEKHIVIKKKKNLHPNIPEAWELR